MHKFLTLITLLTLSFSAQASRVGGDDKMPGLNSSPSRSFLSSSPNRAERIASRRRASAPCFSSSLTPFDSEETELERLKKQAEAGSAEASYDLGQMYELGEGVPQNNQTAFIYYKKAADQDHSNAKFKLALMYREGKGVTANQQKYIDLLKEAAEKDHKEALVLYEEEYEKAFQEACQNDGYNIDNPHPDYLANFKTCVSSPEKPHIEIGKLTFATRNPDAQPLKSCLKK